jgi:hypothetical protein
MITTGTKKVIMKAVKVKDIPHVDNMNEEQG